MNHQIYNAKIRHLLEQAHASLDPDTLNKFDDETTDEIIKAEFKALLGAESERDPEFKKEVVRAAVQREVVAYFEEHRPIGSYDVDKMFPISETNWVKMPDATKEHLLAWSALESDPANREYIASRMLSWNETEHATLADLERSLAEEVPW